MTDTILERWVSYGGGVQTFGMLVAIEKGLIDKPDGLIFSNTMAEHPATIDHINNVVRPLCEKLSIPFVEVWEDDGLIEGYKAMKSIPMVGFKTCTMKYKVDPIRRYFRNKLKANNVKRYGKPLIELFIGISTDESKRVVPRSRQKPKWILNSYPFIKMDWSRRQIIQFIKDSGYEVPIKSGCYICPYQGLKGFTKLKVNDPALFKIAIEMEEAFFEHRPERIHGFLADSRIRLKELSEIPSLFSFVDQLPNEHRECEADENGGCFL